MNLRPVLERVRYATDVAGVCPNGHGGHQFDSRFCRVCGSMLDDPLTGGTVMPQNEKPDVSWTDEDDQRLTAALEELGQPTGGSWSKRLTRLIEADKPEGWKWEG